MIDNPPPSIGREVNASQQQCTFSPDNTPATDCGQPATWHILWNLDIDNSLACDQHMAFADWQHAYIDRHPVGPDCCMPDTVWLDIAKRCAYPDHPAPSIARESRTATA